MASKSKVALFLYIIINEIFIYKYGLRQSYLSVYLSIVLYPLVILGLLFLLKKAAHFLNNLKNFNKLFILFGVAVSLIILLIILSVDKNELNTDRWSAMTVAIKTLLNLEYPYTAIDHLGGRSSNLPGLLLIGIPFYLMGNVGLLQLFVFLVSFYFLIKSKITNVKKIAIVFLLVLSPAYMWEVYVASDLMSNFIIILLFMIYWDNRFNSNYMKRPLLLGFALSILILTRGVVVIPLLIFLFHHFYTNKIASKLKLITTLFIGIGLLILPIILLAPNTETLLNYNPLELQTRQTSQSFQVIIIMLSLLVSFKAKNIIQVFQWSFITLSILLVVTMIGYFFKYGIYQSIVESIFDISYLGILIPFAILTIVLNNPSNEKRSLLV